MSLHNWLGFVCMCLRQAIPFFSLAVDPTHTGNNPLLIHSVTSLILELPTITDPFDFCHCLEISHSNCELIHTNHKSDIKSLVRQIAAEWYKQSPKPSWDKVVDTLFCHQHVKHATELAEKKGVDWKPLWKKWQKNE